MVKTTDVILDFLLDSQRRLNPICNYLCNSSLTNKDLHKSTFNIKDNNIN